MPQHIRLKCADEGTVGTHTPLVRLRPTFLTFLALLTDLLPALRATAAGMMLLTTVLSSRLFFNPLHPPLFGRNGQGRRTPKTISFLRQDHQAAFARSGSVRSFAPTLTSAFPKATSVSSQNSFYSTAGLASGADPPRPQPQATRRARRGLTGAGGSHKPYKVKEGLMP